jgi:hypothetical protein
MEFSRWSACATEIHLYNNPTDALPQPIATDPIHQMGNDPLVVSSRSFGTLCRSRGHLGARALGRRQPDRLSRGRPELENAADRVPGVRGEIEQR